MNSQLSRVGYTIQKLLAWRRPKRDTPSLVLFFLMAACSLECWYWSLPISEVGPEFVRNANQMPFSALLNWNFALCAFMLVGLGIFILLNGLLVAYATKTLLDRMDDKKK